MSTRGRKRSWWLFGLAVLAALPLAGIVRVAGASEWTQLGVLAVCAVLGVVVVELRGRWQQDEDARAAVRRQLAGASDVLPTMKNVRVADVNVHPAIQDIGYMARDAEPAVAQALRDRHRRRVLIAGASMSGKTRLALQVARGELPGHRLFRPRDGKALHALLALDPEPADLLMWLDDVDRFLGADGLLAEDLEGFHDRGAVAVATIRAGAFTALQPREGLKPAGSEALEWFGDPVWLRWSDEELARSQQTLPDSVVEGARRYGLPSYLGGGPLAVNAFWAAESEQPVGHALVRGAADWRRAGLPGPIPVDVLVSLAAVYLGTGDPAAEPKPAELDAGLAWATTKLNHTVSLLQLSPGGYEVLDYIVDEVAANDASIRDRLWQIATERASSSDLVNVGFSAAAEHARPDRAETIWRQSGHPIALYNLGLVRYRAGDERSRREAEGYWRTAAAAGDPGAMYSLGVLLERRGDPASAREAELWSRRAARASGRRTFPTPAELDHAPDEAVEFTGAATDEQRQLLTEQIQGFRRYLQRNRVPLGPAPTLHVDPAAQITYPDPAGGRLFVGAWAAQFPAIVLHEYSHWLLEELAGVARERWTAAVRAMEAGLAYYLPCSFAEHPRSGFVDLTDATALGGDTLDEAHLTGLRWGSVLWRLRTQLGDTLVDPELLQLWRQVSHASDDRATLVDRLCELTVVSANQATHQLVSDALDLRGLGRERG